MSQCMDALAVANRLRIDSARERRELTGAPVKAVAEALIHPSEALGSMRLKHLLTPKGRRLAGPIPRCGPATLNRAFAELVESYPLGRRYWHIELRLRELSETERRRLVRVLIRRAPESWRTAA